MAIPVQWRRGTTAQHADFTGLQGEITVDTDKHSLVVHDGITAGGHPILSESAFAGGAAGQFFGVGVDGSKGWTDLPPMPDIPDPLPAGGATGQVLTKASDNDRDVGWKDISFFEPGTTMPFIQPAAPVGWTKVTDHDNKALRIVSEAGGGSGGTVAFTTAFASQVVSGTIGATTLSIAQMPSHSHGVAQSYFGGSHIKCLYETERGAELTYPTSYVGGNGSHTHSFTGTSINLAVQYVDAIIARKDGELAGGAA